MPRLSHEELEKIKKKHNVDRIWSYSRVSTFITSPYEYALKYVDGIKAKEDRQDSIYTSLGSAGHQCLEDYYTGKIKFSEMLGQFEDSWTTCYDIAQLKFDRCNEEKNKSIAEKYKANMLHFFEHHVPYEYKVMIEMPIVVNIDGNIFVGYIDGSYKDSNGDITVVDFKSSSVYKGKALEEHSKQLKSYVLGIHQTTGIPLSKIHGCFNFMKYVTVEYIQANGKTKTKDVERINIGGALQANLKVWIKKLGYEDQMDEFLKMVLDDNGIDRLPDDLKNMYKIYDCHIFVDTSEEAINEFIKETSTIVKDIELRERDFIETKSVKCFWDTEESIKAQSYYMANLMAYSPNLHLPYQTYLKKLEAAQNPSGMFGNIFGTNSSAPINKVIENSTDDIDLSWLADIT
jgi:hypothetical protein